MALIPEHKLVPERFFDLVLQRFQSHGDKIFTIRLLTILPGDFDHEFNAL
ncbi:hypothetical protein CERZMDRAFT_102672 [Cercospora zeae-maydis SCOH1-5]|uniref:Uncharacterized protein n=1 Tax=Cercospora zeae-maydis SCOH1-5 TaxID=717836 RepID=A0A6A6F498_9PEZI|nr:hypothetical protein CERZMDRAFT_102672 [Cercospora zeae-maydis SCOH1-5]